MGHVDTVQQIYQAFGRGDISTILEQLADEIEWEYGVHSTNVPWLQPRRGRSQVAEFFQALAGLEIQKFEPKQFFESGNIVVALIDLEARVRSSGRKIVEEDEVHIWQFDSRGQVARFRHRVDTYQQWAAFNNR